MFDDNQTFIPESFIALYQDGRKRLTVSREQLSDRYDTCESMATMLTQSCRTMHGANGVDRTSVLERSLQGVRTALDLTEAESQWVVKRLAELLEWQDDLPELPASTVAS